MSLDRMERELMANKTAMQPEPITQEFNHALVSASLTVAEWPTVNLTDSESVKTRVREYFELCDKRGLRPSNLGLYASLNLTRQDVSDVLRERNKSKVSPGAIDIIQKAKLALSMYREQLALSGKVSPPIAIFWSKNFDGMQDVAQVEVTRPDQLRTHSLSPEEIEMQLKRIEQDIPLDSDCEQE